MNRVCEKNKCTGCGLCSNICPKSAIKMIENSLTGHFEPTIDKRRCVNCGLCEKLCPSLKEVKVHKAKICYAAWQVDDKRRQGSSSGGVAAALYEAALKDGYCIVGTFLENVKNARMKVTTQAECIEDFKGSKYVQAECGTIYRDSMERIMKGEKLLFIGTPCQCAAMRSLVGHDKETNLLTVELICHGVPSQKILREYINLMEKKKGKKITSIFFRSSEGEEMQLKSDKKLIWKQLWTEDNYLYAFQKGLLHNASCYECVYARKDRASDLTIGDFWKIGSDIPFIRPNCKVSVVVVNSDKGMSFLKQCNNLHLEVRSYEEAVKGNLNLHHPSQKHLQYDIFWDTYAKKDLEAAFKATINAEVTHRRFQNKVSRTVKGGAKKILGAVGIYKKKKV